MIPCIFKFFFDAFCPLLSSDVTIVMSTSFLCSSDVLGETDGK